ncbi:MAG: bifunctional DNA-binding transcriptional regulator/O6-methylguanine-DNA methyltransferase Ada [Cyanobacteria bacterium J06621_15]
MHQDEYWQAVITRNRSYDGKFVYGVISTKIYCHPSCPSRKPRRDKVVFFSQIIEAENQGFRACKRCFSENKLEKSHLKLIQQICNFIKEEVDKPHSLKELANKFYISQYHLQRTFKKIVGITPHQYAEALRLENLKNQLRQGEKIVNAVYESGYNSSSSLYQSSTSNLGMTPDTYRKGGKNMIINYTIVPCSMGYLLVATTEQGICSVKLGDTKEELESVLYQDFYQAELIFDSETHQNWIKSILNFIDGNEPHIDLPLDIRGTAFQKQVWEALKKIPYGETCTYKDIANQIYKPQSVRAVGNACGANPVALIVPCHRVVKNDGGLGGYRWGIERKKKLLNQESVDK